MNDKHLSLLIGPAKYPEDDQRMVSLFLSEPGKKVICGISTANMVTRNLDPSFEGNLLNIKGLELVTDGTLLLTQVLDLLRNPSPPGGLLENSNDANILVDALQNSDSVSFLIGMAVNKSQRSLSLPAKTIVKSRLVQELVELLRNAGKHVMVEYF